ncbi:MAG: hypothetical protein QXN67_04640 [Thermoproteota archaeon]
MPGIGGLVIIIGLGSIVIGILMLIGAFMINSTSKSRVTMGSILVIIFSIIAVFIGGGFYYIGTILGIIGGILGLIWKPSPAIPPPPPPY